MPDIESQLEAIKRGAVEIYSLDELALKLKSGRPLRVKLGVDPTSPDIHLGHTVVLQKLRQFQDLGHQAVLIIGDFTALIGDPSGREKTRPQLSVLEIEDNARTYLEQVGKVLDSGKLEIVHNSDWLSRLNMENVIRLAAEVTVARFIEREDFNHRLKSGVPVGLHEFLYPLLQGQDSVVVRADIELGGTDQIFNLLVGRDLQRAVNMPPQVVLTMPLLVGLDGEQKMSKSYGNHIGLADSAGEMYGKAMSLPDKLMESYFTLLTSVPVREMRELLKGHPKEAKVRLSSEIVARYYDKAEADKAAEQFEAVFARKEAPEEMTVLRLDASIIKDGRVYLPKLINLSGAVKSSSEARRLISQGGITIDGNKITDPDAEIDVKPGQVLKVGKKNRFYRIEM